MMSKLKTYTFVYLVTTEVGGQVEILYTEATPASVLVSFEEFKTPPEAFLINSMVLLYQPNGQLEDVRSKISTPGTFKTDLANLPTELLSKLMQKLES